MRNFTIEEILYIMRRKGYRIFDRDNQPYNLNLIGIRNASPVPNSFDDRLYLLWRHNGVWRSKDFPLTTDPGTYWLMNPMAVQGTAILKEGQYIGLWKLGLHQGKYEALVQAGPCTVIRDANRDNRLDYDGHEETGFFGINCHRAAAWGTSKQVDKWSAGCQVFADSKDFAVFMALAREAAKAWGDRVTYTLLNERDFAGAV